MMRRTFDINAIWTFRKDAAFAVAIGFVFLATAIPIHTKEKHWPPARVEVEGRRTEIFRHGPKDEWGYSKHQDDTFIVVHPAAPRENAPLYVVLHSAGHDVWSAVQCTSQVGNHDIYRAPKDFYALYLDCRANMRQDWWWGGRNPRAGQAEPQKAGGERMPVERRVINTVRWVVDKYGIDPNRVYLCGNSMGGSGSLGIGVRHGNIFAAIKANVPAGIEHVSDRMFFHAEAMPGGVTFPDPPVVVDYSGVNDHWSIRHEDFATAMNDRKYALYLYWGPFGHANNDAQILAVHDLVHSFDWLNIKRNEAYPVFSNASCNDELPTFGDRESKAVGQINAFFRWRNIADAADRVEMSLYLVSPAQLKTRFAVPSTATADVSLRRIQNLQVEPGQTFDWRFGSAKGKVESDDGSVITIPGLKLTNTPTSLRINR